MTEWEAMCELEPFGGAHEDLRAGYICMLIQNAHRQKAHPALKPEDFFPSLRQPVKQQSTDDLLEVIGQILAKGKE